MPAIEIKNLRKEFVTTIKSPGFIGTLGSLIRPKRKSIVAVSDINFSIEQGEIVGFLGPNGAGKTTTIKMLTGILYPTSGDCKVLGYTPFNRHPEMLRQIALVMGNRQQLWWDLPAIDSFVVLRELYDIDNKLYQDRLDRLVTELDITDKIDTQVRKLSLGERMKCELVAALLHSPRVLFLDEPTIGLDVISQKRIRGFLHEFNKTENCTIVLTSHYMQDVEELCERVIVINHGKLVFDGNLTDLSAESGNVRKLSLTLTNQIPREELAKYGEVAEYDGQVVVFNLSHSEVALTTSKLLAQYDIEDISISDVDVEEVITRLFSRSS